MVDMPSGSFQTAAVFLVVESKATYSCGSSIKLCVRNAKNVAQCRLQLMLCMRSVESAVHCIYADWTTPGDEDGAEETRGSPPSSGGDPVMDRVSLHLPQHDLHPHWCEMHVAMVVMVRPRPLSAMPTMLVWEQMRVHHQLGPPQYRPPVHPEACTARMAISWSAHLHM